MNVDNFTLQQLQDGYKMKIIELQTVSQELTKCQEQLKIVEAKLQELEAEYTTLAQEHNALVEENKKLKEGLKNEVCLNCGAKEEYSGSDNPE